MTSRWLVWIGGLALALGGYFLVVHAVQQGWLGPTARIVCGVLLGSALTVAGEYVRRRPLQQMIASVRPDYVPQALTAGGLATLFGSFYAAHALYGLISPLSAFILLAAVGIGAFGLSVLQGAFVAILGLLAGFVTPALIPSDAPAAAMLFGYLFIVSAACAAVMWYRPWPWLGYGTVAGSAAWTALWLVGPYTPGDAAVIGAYWIAITGMHVYLAGEVGGEKRGLIQFHKPDGIAWVTVIVAAIAMCLAGQVDEFSNLYVAVFGVFTALLAGYALRRQAYDNFVIVAGVAFLAFFGVWMNDVAFATSRMDEAARLAWWLASLNAAWIAGLYWCLGRAERRHVWAGSAVVVPVLAMAAGYSRLSFLATDQVWALVALGVGAVFLGFTSLLRQKADTDDYKLPVGIFAIGVVACVSLAMVFMLREAWLTVALAVQLPIIAWFAHRYDLTLLRRAALVIAAVCVARLALNPFALYYGAGSALNDHWVLYGYGVPMIAFHVAYVLFKRQSDDLLVKVLEGGRLAFLTLLISGEIRVLTAGSLDRLSLDLLETGLHVSSWLAIAWTRWRAFERDGRMMDRWGAVILTGLGCFAAAWVSLLYYSPLFHRVDVGAWPIFNSLMVAYLVPAILLAGILWQAPQRIHSDLRKLISGLVFLLGWAWLTFETRHAFQGSLLAPHISDAENQAYSIVWLIASFVCLFAAIYLRRAELRYASLALILISVLKVFLIDMSDLEGLYRVASFLGLGPQSGWYRVSLSAVCVHRRCSQSADGVRSGVSLGHGLW